MTAPVLEGWFAGDEAAPHLIGTRCTNCGTFHFPPQTVFCRNPGCGSDELEEVPLSRSGKLWSFTNACYPPPPPYVCEEPFEPYAIAAVELAKEGMVVLGQVVSGTGAEALRIGMEMELALETIPAQSGEQHGERLTWKWRPAGGAE